MKNDGIGDQLITFDLRQGRIFIGGGEELAKLLRLATTIDSDGARSTAGSTAQSTSGISNGNRTSVRDFARPFAYRKLYERIAVLFHYAHHVEGRATLTPRDLSDWFGLCGFKTPARMDKALDNVMRQRRLVERSGPGQWSLTPAGESVALDLLEAMATNGRD